jgi:hypothetical protein
MRSRIDRTARLKWPVTYCRKMTEIDSLHYPERLGKLVIVNAPAALSGEVASCRVAQAQKDSTSVWHVDMARLRAHSADTFKVPPLTMPAWPWSIDPCPVPASGMEGDQVMVGTGHRGQGEARAAGYIIPKTHPRRILHLTYGLSWCR